MSNKFSRALHFLCAQAKENGLSAKQSRRFAQEHLSEYLRDAKRQEKLFAALQAAALNDNAALPIGGKKEKTYTHISTRAKQASNACIVSTHGKRRSPIVFQGQQSEDLPETILQFPLPERQKERRRKNAWARGTIERNAQRKERIADSLEHRQQYEMKISYQQTEYGKGHVVTGHYKEYIIKAFGFSRHLSKRLNKICLNVRAWHNWAKYRFYEADTKLIIVD